MHARVVRFTGVNQESIEKVRSQIESDDDPPQGISISSMKMLHDADQKTAIFIAFFDTVEELMAADAVFGAMDGSDTPGTRVSVDRCEVVIERQTD